MSREVKLMQVTLVVGRRRHHCRDMEHAILLVRVIKRSPLGRMMLMGDMMIEELALQIVNNLAKL